MSDFTDALAVVKRACQPDDVPTLTYSATGGPTAGLDLDDIIVACQRGAVWTASTALHYGQIVFPTTVNGQEYEVVRAGTSGTVEPTWSVAIGSYYGPYDYGQALVMDGSAVLKARGFYAGMYDVREACRQACLLKSRRAAKCPDFSADGASIKKSQVRDFWHAEAEQFDPVFVA